MLTDISLSAHTTLPTPNNALHSIGMLALSPGLKRNFRYLEGLGFRVYNVIQNPRLGACFSRRRRHPTRPCSPAIDARSSSFRSLETKGTTSLNLSCRATIWDQLRPTNPPLAVSLATLGLLAPCSASLGRPAFERQGRYKIGQKERFGPLPGGVWTMFFCWTRLPKSRICFPWAAEVLFWASRIQKMLPLGCRNAPGKAKYCKTGEKARIILK